MYLFVDWLINGFMKEICEFLFSSIGKQLENWHLACVFDTCHLALDEGSLLPKIVGVTSHVYGFGSPPPQESAVNCSRKYLYNGTTVLIFVIWWVG